jgi:hypothetical protein
VIYGIGRDLVCVKLTDGPPGFGHVGSDIDRLVKVPSGVLVFVRIESQDDIKTPDIVFPGIRRRGVCPVYTLPGSGIFAERNPDTNPFDLPTVL